MIDDDFIAKLEPKNTYTVTLCKPEYIVGLLKRIEQLDAALNLIFQNEKNKLKRYGKKSWIYEICDKALNYPDGKKDE